MTSFGERLKQLMEDQSISQRDLAAALSVDMSTATENQTSNPFWKLLLSFM